MNLRRSAGEVVVRLLLLAAALATLRFGQLAFDDWADEIAARFDYSGSWGAWLGALALLALTGLLVGLATLPGRPKGFRWAMPLLISVPALLLLGHFVLVFESVGPDGTDLPGILGNVMFYMDPAPQYVLAVVAGFGIAAGLQPRRPN